MRARISSFDFQGKIVIYQKILKIYLFRNNPTIEIYFTVILTIYGMNLCLKIILYNNTKSVFTNYSKHYLRRTSRKLLSTEVLSTF